MRIDGEWYSCDDGVSRPVVRGEILGASGIWKSAVFLVDTGADCTVISAPMLEMLGLKSNESPLKLGGVGGIATSSEVKTHISLPRVDGQPVTFRGQYAAVTQLEALDMSILGRDILNLFSVIVDRPGNLVALVRPPSRYAIQSA